jgi:HAD superfamily hydrolase (TIGR01490 family)
LPIKSVKVWEAEDRFAEVSRNEDMRLSVNKKENKKAVFLDVDGVLTKGYLSNDYFYYLIDQEFVERRFRSKLEKLLKDYSNGLLKRDEFLAQYCLCFIQSIKGRRRSDVLKTIKEFIQVQKGKFRLAKKLVKIFKNNGILPVIISGVFSELLSEFAKEIGCDKVYGTHYEVKKDRYTGRVLLNCWQSSIKEEILKKLVETYKIELDQSFAFGDTISDLPLLKKVGFPIVINAHGGLEKIASERDWKNFVLGEKLLKTIKRKLALIKQT